MSWSAPEIGERSYVNEIAEATRGTSGSKLSDRLVKHWTPTTEEAFGVRGRKGREGELFVKKAIQSWGWLVTDNESDIESQVTGCDLWIQKPTWSKAYSVDVKANLDRFGSFWIYPDEWMDSKKQNDRFWHVNVKTGWMAWYSRQDVQRYIKQMYKTEPFQIALNGVQPFEITRRRYAA